MAHGLVAPHIEDIARKVSVPAPGSSGLLAKAIDKPAAPGAVVAIAAIPAQFGPQAFVALLVNGWIGAEAVPA